MDVIAAGGILSAKQERRRARDWYYMSAHSQQNKWFVEVDEADAAAVRKWSLRMFCTGLVRVNADSNHVMHVWQLLEVPKKALSKVNRFRGI